MVGNANKVSHDGSKTGFAKANQHIVLADDSGGTLGEVKGE